jgi:predicted RNase H-like HicB family nuclease
MGDARHYSMMIQWDPSDDSYVVTVPELPGCRARGKERIEGIKNVLEVIELWIESAKRDGIPIPAPRYYTDADE